MCEGPADQAIIEAVLDYYIEDYVTHYIQPPSSVVGGEAGPFGGGWKGVRTWCEEEGAKHRGVENVRSNSDVFIIQVDSDILADKDIAQVKNCPPAAESANTVRVLLHDWLGCASLPDNVVLCIPSMATETWALVALFPKDPSIIRCDPPPTADTCIECKTDVKAILRKLGRKFPTKLVVMQDGKLKNQAGGYRAQKRLIAQGWPKVLQVCAEAARFHAELKQRIEMPL